MIYVFFSRKSNARSILQLHGVVEEETVIRSFEKSTLSGMSSASSSKINEMINKIDTIENKPFRLTDAVNNNANSMLQL